MTDNNKGLVVEGLTVKIENRVIFSNFNLEILPGQLIILLGPNGCGKTSLLMTILGMPGYEIVEGSIKFKGQELNKLTIDERARLGIGMMFQRPPAIKGVKLHQMAEISSDGEFDQDCFSCQLNLQTHMERDVNLGFSGGEIKRSEMLQLLAQRPELSLFDEPESGVDLENISLIGESINQVLERDNPDSQKMGLIITHTGFILDYVKADWGCVMMGGGLRCHGDPRDIISIIRKTGFEECAECHLQVPKHLKKQ
jgi:Fe-S cluster assembly ATP-binding protein